MCKGHVTYLIHLLKTIILKAIHLAERFTLHSRYTFYQFVHYLGNEPMTLALLTPCSTV